MAESGRPKKGGCDYFSHDADMRNDARIKALRAKFGIVGYGIFCMMLETLTDATCLVYKLDDLSLELLAGDFGIDSEKLKEILDYLIKLGLIDHRNDLLFSKKLDERLRYVFVKRNRVLDTERELLNLSVTKKGVSVTETTRSKVKESKVKESTKKKEKKYSLPFESESFRISWDAYLEMRKKKKYPMTDHSMKLLVTALKTAAGDNEDLAIASLDSSTLCGYRSIFPPKNGYAKNKKSAAEEFLNG